MDRLGHSLVIPLILLSTTTLSHGGQPTLTTEALLARWEAASNHVKVMDSEFARFDDDRVFGKTKHNLSGRFYWEALGRGFYKIEHRDLIVWESDELRLIDYAQKTYARWPVTNIKRAKERLNALNGLSGWERLIHIGEYIALSASRIATVEDVLPLCTSIEAQAIQNRYQVTWKVDAGSIFVTAVPKDRCGAIRFRQIDVQLASDSLHVLAHRTTDPHGSTVVHVFDGPKINTVPADVDSYMHPDLDGLSETLTTSGDADAQDSP